MSFMTPMGGMDPTNRALEDDEIESRFGDHNAKIEAPADPERHDQLRAHYVRFATLMDHLLPEGRDKSLALTHLEEASMWSHKAVAKAGS